MQEKIILSLCDYTGTWPEPFRDAGYTVIQVDIQHGRDVRLMDYPGEVFGVLAAPPCTDFSVSGAQYWPAKDADGRTLESKAILDACLSIVAICKPKFWALENPVGRVTRWLGKPALMFNPCDFGGYLSQGERSHELAPPQDAYTKRTCLWGNFNIPVPRPVEPERACKSGSWIMRLGGSSERTKRARSITPKGFARAFFEANKQPNTERK